MANSAGLDSNIWIGSPAGLFVLNTETATTNPVVHEIPFASVHAVALAGDTLLAAGLPANLIYSGDGGKHWLRATIEGADRPFTSLAPSPNILHDGVVLAGTAGQGIMRSSDGGRFWEFATFGLDDYNVLVVACAPVWNADQNDQEIALAGTADGIFQSPNGGRAWRKCQAPDGATDAIVQSICFSPDFVNHQQVFAGTEMHGLLISTDAGLNWTQHDGLPADLSITALLVVDKKLVAAAGSGEVYTSADLGQTWQLQQKLPFPITCLVQAGESCIAGLVDGGLIKLDLDQADVPSEEISGALRRFDQLDITAGDWHVEEPGVGRWHSSNNGASWQAIEETPTSPESTIDPPLDRLLTHVEGGAATIGADRKTVEVWVQTDAGEAWQKVGAHIAYGRTPRLAVLETETADSPSVALALGPDCHILRHGQWQSFRLGSDGSPLTAIIGLPNGQIACASFDRLHLFDGGSWETVAAPENGSKPLTALALTADNGILGLTFDGVIYRISEGPGA
ncbi:MAG: photosystem II stability/assembly factor-like uncharacterized protein [Cellvibrionaceae bacterium]|jgi:photosystem II stability/assembly factor-like uncharacterized protein